MITRDGEGIILYPTIFHSVLFLTTADWGGEELSLPEVPNQRST